MVNRQKMNHQLDDLSNFIIALTESLFVSLNNLIASALLHFPYSITILIFSGLSPSSDRLSAADYSALVGSAFF
jgi:hypothetical protein